MKAAVVTDTACELDQLWLRFRREREPALRRVLVERHFWLARIVAVRQYRLSSNPALDIRDLVQSGTLGLIQAVERFDPLRGVSFSHFASPRIHGEILDAIDRDSEVATQLAWRRQVRAERAASLRQGLDTRTDLFQELVEVAVGLAIGFMLEDTTLLLDTRRGEPAAPEPSAACQGFSDDWAARVAALPDNQRRVVEYHYLQGLSFTVVADLMGVSRARVSQLHRDALQRLRKMHTQRPEDDRYA